MHPSQSYYVWDCQTSERVQEPSSAVNLMDGGDSMMSSASRSHKDAERRRRQRINAHLSTLRTLLPNATKTDKATLLAQVVQHVKELRKQADDVARQDGDACGARSEGGLFPGESDEATLSYCEVGEKEMKATVCCEDRPGLNLDLARAIRSVRARAVRAEMMTVGGRTKSVVVVKWAGSGAGGQEEVGALERALKAVVENRASGSGLGRAVSGNKRARFYGSFDEGDNAFLLSGL
ncbi:transcription factor bHLH30-like [Corylus avellana]|uniref:transcription factor bHLH30-like n=1 Tax=Corylus avellana TaxID=13451 RepID=UPI00286C720D|nr:transcription factor bHLH30-like [Corylus avellana]